MSEFMPRRFEDIIAGMVALAAGMTTRSTDFNDGSVVRSILESAAVAIERAEVGFAIEARRALEESAYTLWRFPRQQAGRAYGVLRLYATSPGSPITIPQGSRFGVPGTALVYITEQEFVYPAGVSQYDIVVVAQEAGESRNVAANTVTQVLSSLPDITGCTNPEAYFTGTDDEQEIQRRARFATYVRSIHRGTKDALELGALRAVVIDASGYATEQVVDAQADPGTGHADVYIWNGSTGASSGLIDACEQIIEGYTLPSSERVPGFKAAGITVSIVAAMTVAVSVSVYVTLEEGFTVDNIRPACIDAIEAVFAGLAIGGEVYPGQIACAVRAVPGVVEARVASPAEIISPGVGEIAIVSGTPVVLEEV